MNPHLLRTRATSATAIFVWVVFTGSSRESDLLVLRIYTPYAQYEVPNEVLCSGLSLPGPCSGEYIFGLCIIAIEIEPVWEDMLRTLLTGARP